MDTQLATITQFNGLRILKKGYRQDSKFTEGEMRDVIKIIIFVLDELYTTDDYSTDDETISCKILIQFYIKFIKMYITSRQKQFNENDLKRFKVSIFNIIMIPIFLI